MKDTFLIEKKLNILSALYENTDSIEEKRNTKIYYNMLLQDLLKSDSVNKKYYSTKITMEDEPLKIKKIKRLYNANLCKKITEKVIKSFLYENDIELREDNIFDYKFVGLSHNTVRGAAGGAVLCAELLKAQGYITKK